MTFIGIVFNVPTLKTINFLLESTFSLCLDGKKMGDMAFGNFLAIPFVKCVQTQR